MKEAGLDCDPMILSTRSHGAVTELFPIISDFNYVVAKLNIADQVYLLDATDRFLPFGMLPERCLNGKGRVMAEKGSYWHPVKANEKRKFNIIVALKVEGEEASGTVKMVSTGYEAARRRKKIFNASNVVEFIKTTGTEWNDIDITSHAFQELQNIDQSLTENYNITLQPQALDETSMLLSPFFIQQWKKNPFQLDSRLYPVDFGAPVEENLFLTVDFPVDYSIEELPQQVGKVLPGNGGKLIFSARVDGNRLTLNYKLQINNSIYSSGEYAPLKELFNEVVNLQKTVILLKKEKKVADK
jgi:hypothetical protein